MAWALLRRAAVDGFGQQAPSRGAESSSRRRLSCSYWFSAPQHGENRGGERGAAARALIAGLSSTHKRPCTSRLLCPAEVNYPGTPAFATASSSAASRIPRSQPPGGCLVLGRLSTRTSGARAQQPRCARRAHYAKSHAGFGAPLGRAPHPGARPYGATPASPRLRRRRGRPGVARRGAGPSAPSESSSRLALAAPSTCQAPRGRGERDAPSAKKPASPRSAETESAESATLALVSRLKDGERQQRAASAAARTSAQRATERADAERERAQAKGRAARRRARCSRARSRGLLSDERRRGRCSRRRSRAPERVREEHRGAASSGSSREPAAMLANCWRGE